MKIKINDNTADEIVIARLSESARHIKTAIDSLISKGELRPHQREDLKDHISDLAALNRVLEYFGGVQIDWTGYVPIEKRFAEAAIAFEETS